MVSGTHHALTGFGFYRIIFARFYINSKVQSTLGASKFGWFASRVTVLLTKNWVVLNPFNKFDNIIEGYLS